VRADRHVAGLSPLDYRRDRSARRQTMNPLIKFLASTAGRILRIAAGLALVAWGLLGLTGATGIVVALIGLVPLLAGSIDVCVFAPLFRNPFKGAEIRGAGQ
jgi:hypothetical protein